MYAVHITKDTDRGATMMVRIPVSEIQFQSCLRGYHVYQNGWLQL